MAIIDTVTNMGRLFNDLERMCRKNFSHAGARALMEYLDEMSGETETTIEYDPIAWCCEYTEFANFEEFQKDYSDFETLEQVEDCTTIIRIPGGESFIVGNY